ncbi:CBS domain-containing protein [Haematococcus lacustris]|uniref:CBS domain-containing protein n=1 Tax=Haematococcus lacustris TaxID=44745 RepID=A0A699Z3I9_HAELA|nr:CBS domain-containing protein [Haematococcus lacustris]
MDLGTYSPPQAPAAGSSPGQERSRSAGSPGSPGPETPSSKPQVSEADTPEALADVELTSVAPSQEWFKNKDDILTLSYAVVIGVVVAASVFTFDVSIQFIHDLPDIFAVNLGIGGGRATGFQLGDVAIPFRM